jgi:hypothetical protein
MDIKQILLEIDKVSRKIPEFIDPKIKTNKICYELYYKIFLVIKKCIIERYLTEKEVEELQLTYYSVFISILYEDSELFYYYTDYNNQFLGKLINLLEMNDYFESCDNIIKIQKISE